MLEDQHLSIRIINQKDLGFNVDMKAQEEECKPSIAPRIPADAHWWRRSLWPAYFATTDCVTSRTF
jgi:hypothetical protein